MRAFLGEEGGGAKWFAILLCLSVIAMSADSSIERVRRSPSCCWFFNRRVAL